MGAEQRDGDELTGREQFANEFQRWKEELGLTGEELAAKDLDLWARFLVERPDDGSPVFGACVADALWGGDARIRRVEEEEPERARAVRATYVLLEQKFAEMFREVPTEDGGYRLERTKQWRSRSDDGLLQ